MTPSDPGYIFLAGMAAACVAYCLLPVFGAITAMLVEIIQAARGTK